MSVFVEHVPRPVPSHAVSRLVAAQPGEAGHADLRELLGTLGLAHIDTEPTPSGHALAFIPYPAHIRAMHAGAVLVSREAIDTLLAGGQLPIELREPQTRYAAAAMSG